MNSSTSSSRRFVLAALAGLLATIAVFTVISELIVRKFVLPNDWFHAHALLVAKAEHPAIVIGDSRMMTGFVSSDEFANLAFPYATAEDMRVKFGINVRNRVPEFVVLQANPHVLNPERSLPNGDPVRPFEELYRMDPPLFAAAPSYRPRLIDYWKRVLLRKSFVAERNTRPNGGQLWEGKLDPEAPGFERSLEATFSKSVLPEGCSESRPARAYRDLVEQIRGQCDLVLVSPPVSPHLLNRMGKQPGFQEGKAFFQGIADEFDLTLLDYSTLIRDDRLFNDNVHLNGEGAKIFTSEFLADLERLQTTEP